MKPIQISNTCEHETIVELPNGELKWLHPKETITVVPKKSYLEKERENEWLARALECGSFGALLFVSFLVAVSGDLGVGLSIWAATVAGLVSKILR